MKLNKIITAMLVCAMAVSFASCGDDEVEGAESINLTATNPFTVSEYVSGSVNIDSSYTYSLKGELAGGYFQVTGLAPTKYCFLVSQMVRSGDLTTVATVADYGKAKHLSKVTSLPKDSEFGEKVAVEAGHGYVIKVTGSRDIEEVGRQNHHPGLQNPETLYIRVCMEEEIDGGFKMTYQYPFTPEK